MDNYIVEYWISGEYEDREYEYIPFTTRYQAYLIGDDLSQKKSIEKYKEEILQEAKEKMNNDIRFYGEKLKDDWEYIDQVLLLDYIQYSVYRVVSETPKDAIKEWIDDPEAFVEKWTVED